MKKKNLEFFTTHGCRLARNGITCEACGLHYFIGTALKAGAFITTNFVLLTVSMQSRHWRKCFFLHWPGPQTITKGTFREQGNVWYISMSVYVVISALVFYTAASGAARHRYDRWVFIRILWAKHRELCFANSSHFVICTRVHKPEHWCV